MSIGPATPADRLREAEQQIRDLLQRVRALEESVARLDERKSP
jgi:hypothetical protein